MALAARERLAELCALWRRRGHAIGFGLGLAQGFATLGRIGFEGRRDYAVIGPVPNLAARLCDAAADGEILLSQRLLASLEGRIRTTPPVTLALKGLSRPIVAAAVVGMEGCD
jgi:class 3 adenylate cyclase